jgi:hypothetical protein
MELQERIRERAYEIWNTSGRTHGKAGEHWLAAEREILAEMSAAAESKPARAPKRRAVAARAQVKKIAKVE